MLFLSGFNREQGIPEYPVTPACYQDQNSSCQGDIVRFLSIIIAAIFCTFPVSAATPASDDSYIAGYAAAILKFQFGIDLPSLTVRNGNITLPADKLPAEDRTRITQLFSEIPGVTRVEIVEYTAQQPSLASPEPDEAIVDKGALATRSTMLATGPCRKVIYSSHYWLTHAGIISRLPTVIMWEEM